MTGLEIFLLGALAFVTAVAIVAIIAINMVGNVITDAVLRRHRR